MVTTGGKLLRAGSAADNRILLNGMVRQGKNNLTHGFFIRLDGVPAGAARAARIFPEFGPRDSANAAVSVDSAMLPVSDPDHRSGRPR